MLQEVFDSYPKRMNLINSFWGLDNNLCLPPNYVLTGPLTKFSGDLASSLQEKDPELNEWITEAQREGIPVAYVSIGTMVSWNKWEVEALYEGLKKLKIKVIWSMKNPKMFEHEDKDFWVRSWVP